MAERFILQAYLGVWGPLQEKGPQGPSFLRPLGGKRPPRWGGGPAGARGGPSYLFAACGRPAGSPLSFFLLEFSGIPADWLPLGEGRERGSTLAPPAGKFDPLKPDAFSFGCCAVAGMGFEGFPLLGFSGILPEGLSGPAPTGGLLSCAGKKVTKETAGGLCRPPGPQALSFQTCGRSWPSI